MVNSFFDLA
jgi:hypothetical protein